MDKVSNLNWPLYEMNKVGSISFFSSVNWMAIDMKREKKKLIVILCLWKASFPSTYKIGVRCCNYGVEEINSCFSHIIENPPPHK